MKTCVHFLSLFLFLADCTQAQIVISNDANRADKLQEGLYVRSSRGKVINVPKPSPEKISRLIEEDSLGLNAKGYRFAESIAVNLDILELAVWTVKGTQLTGSYPSRPRAPLQSVSVFLLSSYPSLAKCTFTVRGGLSPGQLPRMKTMSVRFGAAPYSGEKS